MQTDKVVSVNIIGVKTGRAYIGDFTIKTVMSMKDEFNADLRRRQILGPSPDGTPPAANMQYRAYIYGQVQARTLEAPDFWLESDSGLDVPDENVVIAVYDAILEAEEQLGAKIKEDSDKALKKLKKRPMKEGEED